MTAAEVIMDAYIRRLRDENDRLRHEVARLQALLTERARIVDELLGGDQ